MPTTIEIRLARVDARLHQLRAHDAAFAVFGADTHRYERHAPLEAAALERWEARQGVTLPEEYRCFVLQLCNGGPGPGYGLQPLDLDEDLETVARSFPWDDHAAAEALRRRRTELAEQSVALFGYDFDDYPDGCLTLCDYGCAWQGELVITGEQRGRVWYIGDSAFPLPALPMRSAAPAEECSISFLDWYEAWLDESFAETAADGAVPAS
ncbi:MAG: SMI1/KNR4 family protein [Myxococcales bacterium]|nr:SMI1/KNR4 family protein [Myxococcales bacterium]MBK7191957.1 SMI1/KNR4 family protein [Myxococcales bacterium]MBP6842206.1 SMI1/KNR4 family protein [Kofleriaceae bacterium]